jgi:hypothetical protein
MHGEEKECILDFVRKPDGKKLLGRPRCRWEDNIKMDHSEIVWGDMKSRCQHGSEVGVP